METIKIEYKKYVFDASSPMSIALPLSFDSLQNPNAYYAPIPSTQPFIANDFIGLLSQGSPVNYRHLFFSPHGNGTHTECIGHIVDNGIDMYNAPIEKFSLAYVCSVYPTLLSDGNCEVQLFALQSEIEKAKELQCQTFIIRTLPNEEDKKQRNYSGNNPPYIQCQVIQFLVDLNFNHIVTDLPSLDPEKDEGKLSAHKCWWQVDSQQPRLHATITELAFIADDIKDGLYLMQLQFSAMKHDAVPSNPILYPIIKS